MDSGKNLKIDVEGGVISYDLYRPKTPAGPPIIFLPGLVRQKNEGKSINLQSLCKRSDLTFLAADYLGVGRSSGKFSDGTVGKWTKDTIYLIDKLIPKSEGKVILVGHAMGAWISFLIAKQRPDLVSGIVGMASDPDFTEELLWRNLSEDIKKKIMDEGMADITWGGESYPISRNLILDGREKFTPCWRSRLCKDRMSDSFNTFHEDEEVPYQLAMKLAENCASSDASVLLIRGANHAMEGDKEHHAMRSMIKEVMDAFKGEFDLRSPGSG